jgi:hypothetical protein
MPRDEKLTIPATAEEWERWIELWPWTFAKTAPEIPHWYAVRGWVDDRLWDGLARFVADNGFRGIWTAPSGYQQENTYLPLGVWQYWVIEDVINRDALAESNVVPADGGSRGHP